MVFFVCVLRVTKHTENFLHLHTKNNFIPMSNNCDFNALNYIR